ncbi:MAG: Na-K-Cl cotransporter [Acidobacteriota bacterium]
MALGSNGGAAARNAGLSTFYGVFTPSILTILGVVLFLRTGWVVANVGLMGALAIVLLAHIITVSTALSVSAIATNMQVGAGGAYFMISRSLGLEIGGAIGIPLFLAQTFSVTLYSFGLAESLRLFWPELPMRPVAAATVLVVSLLAGKSAHLALKAQVPIMVAIALALISLFIGAAGRVSESVPLWSGLDSGAVGFWQVFAVFFPAVTGLMAGISLSGDLANPTRSIVRGTLYAVGVGFAVYLTVPFALAAAADPQSLAEDNLIWFKLAAVPVLIFPGLFGAILSSALGSILGAPRTLDALAGDRVVPAMPPKILGLPIGKQLPHLLSTAVALAAVGLGGLNAVAPILTMFFLTTYGVINLVAGIEKISRSPSFRPTISVPWVISLLGAFGCVWVMILINPLAAAVAIVVETAVYLALRRRSLGASWGDLRYGALMSLVRTTLLRLRRLPMDPRNWRPHILVFADDAQRRLELIRFSSWLNQNRGILTVSELLIGDLEELAPAIPEHNQRTNEFLHRHGIVAFAEVEIARDFESGALNICQANGIAGLASNTIMFGWSDQLERLTKMLRIARGAASLGKSTILCRIAKRKWARRQRRIDIWWGGLENNGDMLLLFAYLVSLNREWSGVQLAVKTVASNQMTLDQTQRGLTALIERCRIKAHTKVIERSNGETVRSIIERESYNADAVFLGLKTVKAGEEEAYARRLMELVGDLPTVVLVRAAGPFTGQLL